MRAEYKLGNFTPKGWVLKCAEDAYDGVIKRNQEKRDTSLALVVNPREALEKAVYAALDAAKEVGFFD